MTGNGFPDDLDYGQTIQIPRFGPKQKIFRRYTLQKILGRGGMGVVWLARDDQLETLVALKVLPDALCHDRASLDALKRETKLGLLLAHPNIVRIYDFQQDDNAAAISMEYVDGVTLSDVRSEKPEQVFSPSDLQPYVAALCDALNYAHARRKIVHRDLKPRNLMLNSEGELKVADFGISRSISESMIMVTGKLGSTGSPPYISPQQWDGDKPSPSDDIYSVGATLYELLTSKPPLLGVVDWQKVHSHIPPPMWRRRNDLGITGVAAIPDEWEEAIAACLAKDPKDRPQTIMELQARLADSRVKDLEEVADEDLFGDTIVIPRAPSPPRVEVPVEPLVEPKPTVPAPTLRESPSPPKVEVPPPPPLVDTKSKPTPEVSTPPLVESKVEAPAPPLVEAKPKPAPEVPRAPSVDTKPKEKPEVLPTPLVDTKPKPKPEVPPAPLAETRPAVSAPTASETKEKLIAANAAAREIDELPLQAEAKLPTAPSFPEQRLTPLAEAPDFIIPQTPPPTEKLATGPNEEFFPQTPTQAVPGPERSYPSPRRVPRWVWAAAGAAIFLLFGSFFIWRKPPPPAVPPSAAESPHVQSTPSIAGFTLDIDSVGKSPDAKPVFPKHVRAFVNGTALKLKGDNNRWDVEFGGKLPPLPFDLEVSAPGYQPAVLHFEHVDDLKNQSPLRLDREQGNIAFRRSGTSDFTTAQLKMVEPLPGQNEDVVVDSSTLVQDLSATTPVVVLPTGVYEVVFQSRNKASAVKPTLRVAVQSGVSQPVDVPKPPPAVAATATPHPTNPPVSVTTTNETAPPAHNLPKPVIAPRETPAPPAVIPSPTVAIAKENPSPANILPAPVVAPRETPAPPPVIPSPVVPKTSPAVAARGTPHPTNPPVSGTTTNETEPLANNPPTPVTTIRETPAPPPLIPSPTVAIARETPAPAIIPPAPSIAPKESPSPANIPPTPAYAVKESPAPKNPSPPAAETPPPRANEKVAKSTERKTKKVAEPPREKVATRSPAASPKASATPTRKKTAQPFEGGVPGG